MMRKKDPELLVQGGLGATRSEMRLELALKKAFKWQTSNVEETKVEYNDHMYYGPHKWIICLIGSDSYSVSTFKSEYEKVFAQKHMQNLSISIVALSSEPLRMHAPDYKALVDKTSEGTFMNIVNKSTADHSLNQLTASMDVYPSTEMPIIKELFQTI